MIYIKAYLGVKINGIEKTLTIAGSDTSAGAGMQADLKHSKS